MKTKSLRFWICIILSTLFATAMFTQTLAEKTTVRPEKIENSLWEYMQTVNDDKLIPVNISLCGVDENLVLNKLEEKTGWKTEVFQDDVLFEKEIYTKIADALELTLGSEKAHATGSDLNRNTLSDEDIKTINNVFSNELKFLNINAEKIIKNTKKDNSISIIDYTLLQVRQNYQTEKNKIFKTEQTNQNNKFITNFVKDKKSIVTFVNSYIPSVYLSATKEDIMYYAELEEVQSICYNDPKNQLKPTLSAVTQQVGADATSGTKSSNYNNGAGYKGAGINIGIVEVDGRPDTTSPHYDSSRMTILDSASTTISTHASLVTAIAAGNSVGFNGSVYAGVAPSANVYITTASTVAEMFEALTDLANEDVDVINLSLSAEGYDEYSFIDRDLDEFIDNTGIICVVAAGNNAGSNGTQTNRLESPAFALNCIAVGNVQTKSSGSTKITIRPYSMHPSSSWEEPNALPSKPDVCAPGTWIRAVRTKTGDNNFYYDLERQINSSAAPTGTSFAAPIVTGIVAQMLQAKPVRIGRPQAIKAKIMNACEPSWITTSSNGLESSSFLRDKSGAGMINAKKAVVSYAYKHAWNHYTIEPNFITQFTISLSEGQKIRATLAFGNKNSNVIITNNSQYYNMDLRIVDSESGEVLNAATKTRNNVEIVEYTATKNCTVYIQTRIVSNVSGIKTDWALEVDRYN